MNVYIHAMKYIKAIQEHVQIINLMLGFFNHN